MVCKVCLCPAFFCGCLVALCVVCGFGALVFSHRIESNLYLQLARTCELCGGGIGMLARRYFVAQCCLIGRQYALPHRIVVLLPVVCGVLISSLAVLSASFVALPVPVLVVACQSFAN